MNTSRAYWVSALIALILAGLFFFAESAVPFLGHVNVKGRDFFFWLRHSLFSPPPESDQIVLVNLDDETLRRIQTRWPYPRSIYGEALGRLVPFSPRAIGFDLIFSGSDASVGSDSAFVQALGEAGNVVIAAHRNQAGEIGPSPLIRRHAWRVGIVDKPRDRDRVIRRAYLSFPIKGERHSSWELELFRKAFSDPRSQELPERSNVVIDYRVPFHAFPQVPFWRLLEGSILAKDVQNKIVLVGLTAEAFHDIHNTPLGAMPGLSVNANVLLMLIRKSFFSFGPAWIKPVLAFFSFWLMVLMAAFGPLGVALLGAALLIFMFLTVSFLLFSAQVILDFWLLSFGVLLVLIGTILVRELYLAFAKFKLREESGRDPLTGFYSRKFLDLKLKWELNPFVSRRFLGHGDSGISVVIFDLDHFHLANDRLGREAGDKMLSIVAQTIRSSVRKNELISRYGNDEFAILLLNTSQQDALKLAEKIRKLLGNNPELSCRTADGSQAISITVSVGVASSSGMKSAPANRLLKAAEQALSHAKSEGGDRVCVFDSALEP